VGSSVRLIQPRTGIRIAEVCDHGFQRERRGPFAGLGSAHPVGNEVEPELRIDQERVLVYWAHETAICQAKGFKQVV
jgi:hypothetical protein